MIGTKNITALRNRTFSEIPFKFFFNGNELNLTDAVIKIDIKKDACSLPALALTSIDNNGITITEAVKGKFKINEQIITIPAFNYQYDIKITFPNGTTKTWIGGLFQVINTITE